MSPHNTAMATSLQDLQTRFADACVRLLVCRRIMLRSSGIANVRSIAAAVTSQKRMGIPAMTLYALNPSRTLRFGRVMVSVTRQ